MCSLIGLYGNWHWYQNVLESLSIITATVTGLIIMVIRQHPTVKAKIQDLVMMPGRDGSPALVLLISELDVDSDCDW